LINYMGDLKHWGGVLATLQNDTPDGADEKQWPAHAAKSAHALRRIDQATTPEEVFQRVDEVEAFDWLNSPLLDGLKSLRHQKESEALGYAPSAAVASYLMDHGATVNVKILSVAAEMGCCEVVELLSERGIDLDWALSRASSHGHIDVVKLLLNRGACPDDWCLQNASERGHRDVVELLLDQGVSRRLRNAALMMAARNGRHDVVELLLDRKANPKGKGLADASMNGHYNVVKLLLDRGANPNASSGLALQVASRAGQRDVVNLLLDRGADPNAEGNWSLLDAAMNGHRDVVELLLDRGARLSQGLLRYVYKHSHCDIAKLIMERFAHT
jgi:hypothetical protein